MKQRRIVPRIILIVLPCLMAASARDAAQSVHEGLEHFQQGQFEEAARAFEKADEAVPNDARIAFNRGCAAAACGDAAGAVVQFQRAAASTDPKLAAAGRYGLGCLAAIEAKTVLGEKPQDAAPQVREAALQHLARAVQHYRDGLKLDPGHEDTRYNVETIRHWLKHMKELWRRSDRRKMRDSMKLLDYVLLLEKEQREIRTLSKTLGKQTDTPLLREQLHEAGAAQEDLALEIEPLKEKVIAALTQPQSGQQGAGIPTADVQKAVALLGGLADQARTEMTTAAEQLASARTPDALKAQAAAVEMLDQIYMAVVPYPGLLKRAVDTQRELAGRTAGVVAPSESQSKNEVDKSEETTDDETLAQEQPQVDLHESAWEQRFVTRWSEVMAAKAKQGLKQMPPQTAKPTSGLEDKKMEGLRKSMQLAVELGPQVETLTDEAATHLDEEQPTPARPKQKEALRLLEEIAKPLEDQDNKNQQQQQDNKDNKDQKKQDQKKDDKDKKDKDKKEQDKKQGDKDKDKEKKDKDKQGDKDKKKPDKKKSPQDPKKMKGQKDKTPARKKAEAALRRARGRQREHREMEKAVEAQLYRPGTVEKDW